MSTPSIKNMSPEQIMRKVAFTRAIPQESLTDGISIRTRASENIMADYSSDPIIYDVMTQNDFLREFDPNSHKINSLKYYANVLDISDNQYKMKIRSRVSIAFQERIHTKRHVALLGNNVNHRIIRTNTKLAGVDLLAQFREGWEDKEMEVAISDAIDSDFKTGDCAICFYLAKKRMGWRVFSYDKGDILYPHYNRMTGQISIFGRLYSEEGEKGKTVKFLDVWDDTHYMRYKQGWDGDETPTASWVVDQEPVKHGYPYCPVAYHRYGGPVWTPSQSLIDNYEMGISQFCENNQAYALRILYALGNNFKVKASVDGTPMQINSPSPDSKIGFLEPADASESFAKQLDTLEKNIMRSSFAVETPEIKSGSDMSSLTVKMLFADSYLRATKDSLGYQIWLDRITDLFKYGYGIESTANSTFNTFKVKSELQPFVFMSETEIINAIVQLVGTGAMSRQTASEIAYNSGYGTADEWERIINEAHEELVAEAQATQSVNAVSQARQNK